MSQKRTLDGFFKPASKKVRLDEEEGTDVIPAHQLPKPTEHSTYPFPIAHLAEDVLQILSTAPATSPKVINNQPDLDLMYFTPYIPRQIVRTLFEFLRRELPFYRVQYTIKRGQVETKINTPRYTTVFGVDTSARFTDEGVLVSAASRLPLAEDHYQCHPRPIPDCLDVLRILTEASTGSLYNFALVNYYASGDDSISYHSDDERFLGPEPAIASFSLGATRDFLMKHKQHAVITGAETPLKLKLGSGDLVLMRGQTQSCWLHSIPKRKGAQAEGGRINITFRRALIRAGTENYYRYNVGGGDIYRWSDKQKAMAVWETGC